MTRTICVIDDDLAILEVIKLVLEEEGYQVITDNGHLAYDVVEQVRPDLVLLDVWMQGQDGRDISRQIKKNIAVDHPLPVVLMSAHSDASKSVQEAQADDFLEKPFGMDELIQKVEQVLT